MDGPYLRTSKMIDANDPQSVLPFRFDGTNDNLPWTLSGAGYFSSFLSTADFQMVSSGDRESGSMTLTGQFTFLVCVKL